MLDRGRSLCNQKLLKEKVGGEMEGSGGGQGGVD